MSCMVLDMMIDFQPWQKYGDLTPERLSIVAEEFRRVRHDCVNLHQPELGDGDWSLGSRIYQRTYFAIFRLAEKYDWLTINQELKALQFSFSIGIVPLRFYKGDPDDPPSRYLAHTDGEARQIQTSFEFEGLPTLETVLRFAITPGENREAASIHLVEIDEVKEVVAAYRIPFNQRGAQVVPLQATPVILPPITAEPRRPDASEELETGNDWTNAAAG